VQWVGPYQGMERRSQASPEGSSFGAVDDHVVGCSCCARAPGAIWIGRWMDGRTDGRMDGCVWCRLWQGSDIVELSVIVCNF
jgi:hypothetical protein